MEVVEQTTDKKSQAQSDNLFLQLDDKEALEADPRGDPFAASSLSKEHEALGDADSKHLPTDEAVQMPEGNIPVSPSRVLSQHLDAAVSSDPEASVEEAWGPANAQDASPTCGSDPTSTQLQQGPAGNDGEPVASAAVLGDVAESWRVNPTPDGPAAAATQPVSPQHQQPPAEPSSQACSPPPAENGDFGNFGDFGGFEDAQPADTHPVSCNAASSIHTPGAQGSRDTASLQLPASASPDQHAASITTPPDASTVGANDDDFDDFGDFGDFEDAPAASGSSHAPPAPITTTTTTSNSSWVPPLRQQPSAGPPSTPAPDVTTQEGGNILVLKDAAFLSEVQHRWADLAPPEPPPGALPQAPAPAALLSALRSRARVGAAARNTVVACNGLPLEAVARGASSAAGTSSTSCATDSIAACKLQWKGTPAEARLLELLGLRALGSAATATGQDTLRSAAGGSSALAPGQSEALELASTDASAPSSSNSLSWSSYESSAAAPFAMPSTFPGYKPQDLLL